MGERDPGNPPPVVTKLLLRQDDGDDEVDGDDDDDSDDDDVDIYIMMKCVFRGAKRDACYALTATGQLWSSGDDVDQNGVHPKFHIWGYKGTTTPF